MINFLVEVGVLDSALLLEGVAALVDCSLRVLLVVWCWEFPMLQVGVYIQL